jgi:hypothetical protein
VVPTCRCQREREGGGLLVALGRRPAVRGCRAGKAGQVGRRAGWRARQAGCAVLGHSASGLLLLLLGYCWVGLERKRDEGK